MYYRKSRQSPHYLNKYRLARNKVISRLRCERRKYLQQLQTGSKYFWKVLSCLTKACSSIPTLQTEHVITTTPQQKVDLLSSTFEKNFNVSATPLTQGGVLPTPLRYVLLIFYVRKMILSGYFLPWTLLRLSRWHLGYNA